MSRFLITLAACWALSFNTLSLAAGEKEIKVSIDRATKNLLVRIASTQGGEKTLAALALFKAGVPIETPELQTALQDVLKKFTETTYSSGPHSFYEAGVEATWLADLDAEKYQPQLKLLADYIVKHQLPTGAWDYEGGGHGPGCVGDTSVTQYACLGLWAVQRAGIDVDPQVWIRVLEWHAKYKNADDGFAYTPTMGASPSTINMTVNAVGSLHIGMLHLDPDFFPLKQKRAKKVETQAPSPKKFGVLEQLKIKVVEPKKSTEIPEDSIKAVRKIYAYLIPRFTPDNPSATQFKAYYFYSLERMAALANLTKIGDHDWYQECSDWVLKAQNQDGSWSFAGGPVARDTAFCLLFLTRSTAKVLHRTPTEPGLGDGTLAGGRGLPDDLLATRYDGQKVENKSKPVPPLEKLLASLQNTGDIPLDTVQDQLVESIQLSDRKALIGHVEQLVKLAKHPSAEVRRTAIWAIGRTDRLDLGTLLIHALDDPDLSVIIEARNALCWLSRKPLGFGEPENPLANLDPAASSQQKADAIASWHHNLVLNWGEWYLQNRPFDDRGDQFEADLKREIKTLKQNTK